MSTLLSVLNVLLPMVYAVVFGTYLWLFLTEHPTARRLSTRLALVAVFLHLIRYVTNGLVLERLPLSGALEFSSLLALAMLVTYLVIEIRIKVKSTGFLVTGMAFFLVFLSSAIGAHPKEPSPLLTDPGYAGHAVLVLLSYTALSLSFLYAVLYIVLSRQLMRHQFGLLFRRLPSLEVLERMSVGAVKMGVPLMFLSLCLGHLWMYDLADRVSPEMAATLSPYDPKIMASWIILLGYTLGLAGYRFLGWRGRRMNIMSIGAYVTVVATMGVIHHFFPTFHNFRTNQVQAQVETAEAPVPSLVIERDGGSA